MQGEDYNLADGVKAGACLSDGLLPGCSMRPAVKEAAGKVTQELAASAVAANVDALSTFTLAAFYSAGPRCAAAVQAELFDRVRNTGFAAFVSAAFRDATRAPAAAQAAALLASAAAGSEAVPAVAAGTAAAVAALDVSYASALSAMALAAADAALAVPAVDLSLDVAAGATVLLSAAFDGPDTPVATETTPIGEVAGEATLRAAAVGTGAVTVTTILSFVPADAAESASFAGLFVTQAIRDIDPISALPIGNLLAAAPLASTVAVTVSVRLTHVDVTHA